MDPVKNTYTPTRTSYEPRSASRNSVEKDTFSAARPGASSESYKKPAAYVKPYDQTSTYVPSTATYKDTYVPSSAARSKSPGLINYDPKFDHSFSHTILNRIRSTQQGGVIAQIHTSFEDEHNDKVTINKEQFHKIVDEVRNEVGSIDHR
jgi:hypothetical protein